MVIYDPALADQLLQVVTNALKNDSVIQKLQTQIRLEERRIKEVYGDLPQTYVSTSSETSSNALDKLIVLWKEHDVAISNLNSMKLELLKLKVQKLP